MYETCQAAFGGFNDAISCVNAIVWGWPVIILLLGTGIFLSVGLKFYTLRNIPYAFGLLRPGRHETGEGDITPFQALATALSATIGNGNIVGVALAITIGGPGAIFWMWVMALVGMATKYGEAVLAVKYRETDSRGRFQGGPMYYIKNGMGKNWYWLGWLFAFFAMLAAFGIGNMFQAEAVAHAVAGPVMGYEAGTEIYANVTLITGFVLAALTFLVILGGVKRIGAVAQVLMPFMATAYVLAGLAVLAVNAAHIPAAFGLIFSHVFSVDAAGGGIAWGAIVLAMRQGLARGIFSNEAGLGSAAIAHAAAKTDDPVRQGTIAMLGTFIDTIIVCTVTALAILTVTLPFGATGEMVPAWQSGAPAATLTAQSFGAAIPFGALIVSFATILFAYTTLIGWSYYGERSAEFIFGVRVILPYRILWVVSIVLGTATFNLEEIRLVSDTMNGLMAVPNLIALLALSGVIFAATKDAQARRAK